MTRLVCLSLALAAIAACRDATFPAAPRAFAVDRSSVTGAAAAALNSEGFVDLSPQRAWSRTELTEMGAKALADAYVRDFVPTLPAWFERHRGADIDFTSLQACGRAFYAATPYEEPDVSMPVAVVNAIASRWLFSYCDRPNVPCGERGGVCCRNTREVGCRAYRGRYFARQRFLRRRHSVGDNGSDVARASS